VIGGPRPCPLCAEGMHRPGRLLQGPGTTLGLAVTGRPEKGVRLAAQDHADRGGQASCLSSATRPRRVRPRDPFLGRAWAREPSSGMRICGWEAMRPRAA
jgi:hypothetical protein